MESLYDGYNEENGENPTGKKEKCIDFGPVKYHHISSVYAWKYLKEHRKDTISHFEWKTEEMKKAKKRGPHRILVSAHNKRMTSE